MVLQLLGVRFPADRRLLYQKLIVMIILKKMGRACVSIDNNNRREG